MVWDVDLDGVYNELTLLVIGLPPYPTTYPITSPLPPLLPAPPSTTTSPSLHYYQPSLHYYQPLPPLLPAHPSTTTSLSLHYDQPLPPLLPAPPSLTTSLLPLTNTLLITWVHAPEDSLVPRPIIFTAADGLHHCYVKSENYMKTFHVAMI